jgi:hypothetical protein
MAAAAEIRMAKLDETSIFDMRNVRSVVVCWSVIG